MRNTFTKIVFTVMIFLSLYVRGDVYLFAEEDIHISRLDFENAEIASVFSALADLGNRNIILDSEVTGKITITLRDLSWREALLAVLSAANLTAYEEMGFIKVLTLVKFNTQLEQIRQQEETRERFKPKNYIVIPIHNATALEIKNSIDPLIAVENCIITLGV